jgi:hypothetical protein
LLDFKRNLIAKLGFLFVLENRAWRLSPFTSRVQKGCNLMKISSSPTVRQGSGGSSVCITFEKTVKIIEDPFSVPLMNTP